MITEGLFTSESVADGHPDKFCDQVSDAVRVADLSFSLRATDKCR